MYSSDLIVNAELNVINNTAFRNGGGIYLYQSEFVCQNQCRFLNNLANDSGGGIYAMGSSIIVGRKVWKNAGSETYVLTFTNNTANKGGGVSLKSYSKIYGFGEESHIYKIKFLRNSADYGGAIFVDNESNIDICTSNFSQHEASTNCLLQKFFIHHTRV